MSPTDKVHESPFAAIARELRVALELKQTKDRHGSIGLRMKHPPSTLLRRVRWRHRRTRIGRLLHGPLYVSLGIALVFGFAAGVLLLRLSSGPLSFAGLSERVAASIASRIGPGWSVVLSTSALELADGSLALRASGLDIRNPDGVLVVRAPDAVVAVGTLSLLTGGLQPRSLELRDLQVRAALNRDGSLSFVAAEGSDPQAVTLSPPVPNAGEEQPSPGSPAGERSALSTAIASLFDLVLEPRGVVGAIDRARLTNARLTLVDADRRERATFRQVDASFERAADGRRFELRLEGPRGAWRIGGDLRSRDGGREGTLTATDVPVEDLLLLSGLSKVPAETDLKLSGEAEAELRDGKVTRFDGRLATGAGTVQIDDKDMPPIDVEAATAHAVWDESRQTLALNALTLKSGGTDIRLAGELSSDGGQGLRIALSGRDAVVRGAEPSDPPVRIGTIDTSLRTREGSLIVERLRLQGEALDVSLSGVLGSPADPRAVRADGRAVATSARTLLRLWPNGIVHKVRNYLVANLREGMVETLDLAVAMSGEEIVKSMSGGPIPDRSSRIAFTINDGHLKVADGLPHLAGLMTRGTVTGTTAQVSASGGRIQMADGRSLAVSDGTFDLPDTWADDATANVAFRVEGGADALGAFLQSPLLQDVSGFGLDPAQIKGRTELRVALGLPVRRVPQLAELPLTISGTIGGLTVDKAFGKERLENANLAIAYEAGGVAIKGEGRLWGAPAVIDVRQPKAAPAEAYLSFTLDEAMRVRKGVSFGSQLTGPVPVRVALPVGKNAKAGAKVEADLTRAVVDNLVPGWVKAAGKPGKLSFVAVDGSAELRDFALDSGTVQMRGTLTLSAEGHLDKADLSTFKLSPGDDMRVQLERSGGVYRIVARGPVADARPFLRSLTAASTGASSAREKEGRDLDLDIAANILTGFNDEALTNATIKAAIRSRDLRQFQLNGRLRAASVTAQLRRAGTPLLVLESQDAGGTLRFVDLYRRMHGGALSLQITTGDGPQRGLVTVDSFTLRDEPALKRIASTQPQAAMPEDRAAGAQRPRLDANEVQFARLHAEFSRTANRLDFQDAVIFGTQVGFKIGGWIDYGRDRADIAGTFVPVYGLNNIFAQVPLVGPILGGGHNEGLFAVNFRISGLASSPTLTVNPLSVVAPGFLRKLFGAVPFGVDASGATGAPPRAEQ